MDRWSIISDARFEEPYAIASGTNYITAILAVVQAAYPDVEHDLGTTTLTTPDLFAEEGSDRGDFLHKMATAIGQELFFDGDGVLRLRPISLTSATPQWELVEGEGGLLLTASRPWNTEGVYNRVIASGEPIDDAAPVRGVATDNNPTSPTYYYGEFGKRPRFYVSQFIATATQAEQAATGILASTLGSTQQVNFGTVVNPAIQPNDVAIICRVALGIDETNIIDKLTIPLKAEEPMTGATRVAEVFSE
jgi:hypothetical protein